LFGFGWKRHAFEPNKKVTQMQNPFANRNAAVSGPTTDIAPVSPDDNADLSIFAVALYVETGGFLSIVTVAGVQREVEVADFSFLPVGVARVRATGTTAAGIHALVLA
jgi:hypothetical protein